MVGGRLAQKGPFEVSKKEIGLIERKGCRIESFIRWKVFKKSLRSYSRKLLGVSVGFQEDFRSGRQDHARRLMKGQISTT